MNKYLKNPKKGFCAAKRCGAGTTGEYICEDNETRELCDRHAAEPNEPDNVVATDIAARDEAPTGAAIIPTGQVPEDIKAQISTEMSAHIAGLSEATEFIKTVDLDTPDGWQAALKLRDYVGQLHDQVDARRLTYTKPIHTLKRGYDKLFNLALEPLAKLRADINKRLNAHGLAKAQAKADALNSIAATVAAGQAIDHADVEVAHQASSPGTKTIHTWRFLPEKTKEDLPHRYLMIDQKAVEYAVHQHSVKGEDLPSDLAAVIEVYSYQGVGS